MCVCFKSLDNCEGMQKIVKRDDEVVRLLHRLFLYETKGVTTK